MLGRAWPFLIAWGVGACGIDPVEYRRMLQLNRDQQKAEFDAELRKARAACKTQVQASEDHLSEIEKELKLLGLDVDFTKSDLGGQLKSTLAELELLRQQRAQAERDASAFKAIADKLKSMVDAGKIQVTMRKGRMTLKMPDEILFPTGSKKLLTEGTETLVSVIGVLDGVEGREFLIAGHTDNVPLAKSSEFKSNWELSTARALEVVNVMVAAGIPPQQLAAVGYGEFDPIADNASKEGRAQNRRLEIILMPKIDPVAALGAKP